MSSRSWTAAIALLAAAFSTHSQKSLSVCCTRSQDTPIDRAFFRARIAAAWTYRQQLGFSNACRVVFGESDGLPGLTVDKFGDYLSFQIVCLGMEQRKEALISILAELFQPAGIYERDDLAVREKEGMAQISRCVYGSVPPEIQIREHDAAMFVNIPTGQKTGHFLDQQENRGHLRPYVPGQDVLDLCCCTGGFAIHAALYGAAHVEAVDVSASALALVRRNAAANGVADKIQTTQANVFDLARQYADEGRRFGVVICDPPAFAKSKQALDGATRGYKELNLRCMQMVKRGGFLLTCSCSQVSNDAAPLFPDAAAGRGRQRAAGPAGGKSAAKPGPPCFAASGSEPLSQGAHSASPVMRCPVYLRLILACKTSIAHVSSKTSRKLPLSAAPPDLFQHNTARRKMQAFFSRRAGFSGLQDKKSTWVLIFPKDMV